VGFFAFLRPKKTLSGYAQTGRPKFKSANIPGQLIQPPRHADRHNTKTNGPWLTPPGRCSHAGIRAMTVPLEFHACSGPKQTSRSADVTCDRRIYWQSRLRQRPEQWHLHRQGSIQIITDSFSIQPILPLKQLTPECKSRSDVGGAFETSIGFASYIDYRACICIQNTSSSAYHISLFTKSRISTGTRNIKNSMLSINV
jgi:hypothetical protein